MLLRYNNSDRHNGSLAKLEYLITLARSVTYKCPDMVDSRKIHLIFLILCLPGIFCSEQGFCDESICFFSKNPIGNPGFGVCSLAIA